MTVNESYNEEAAEANAVGSTDSDVISVESSTPAEENSVSVAEEGADEKNDELLSNANGVPSSDKEEETNEGEEEEKIPSSLGMDTTNDIDREEEETLTNAGQVEETEISPAVNKSIDEEDTTAPSAPSPPTKINEDLIQQLSSTLDSCEQMRRINLEVEYSSASPEGWAFRRGGGGCPSLPKSMAVNHDKCTYCQREAWKQFLLNPTKSPSRDDDNGDNTAKGGVGGGGINIGSLKLDGHRIKNLDGSRIRRFRSNVGSFFAKSNDEEGGGGDNNNQDDDVIRKGDDDLFLKASDSMDTAPKGDDVSSTGGGSDHGNSFEGESSTSNNNINSVSNSNTKSTSRKKFLQKPTPPCLTCGHPVCKKHQSSTFSTSSIRICQPCAQLFELDFLVDVITTTASNRAECRKKVNQMVDCYDRAKLLLLFTSQYTDQIAEALEHSTVRSNKIGVGSSATGMVSGMAGVVGCGALLFPPVAAVGIPLLISSLVFGGAATAAQTGDAAVQYFSEPNKLADKMVALHGMMLSLLRISEVLSYGLLKDHDDLEGDADDKRKALAEEISALLEKHGVATKGVKGLSKAVVGGAVVAEVAAAGAEISATSIATTGATVAGRSSRFFGRVGTTAASSARFIPIAGGILSAACVVVEGKELKKTVSKINEGNPCAKAEQIRSIRDEIDKFPDSSVIADECRRVFEIAEKECAFF